MNSTKTNLHDKIKHDSCENSQILNQITLHCGIVKFYRYFFKYFESVMYCIIKENKITPNVIISNLSFNSLCGSEVTSATDKAPRIPPIIIIFCQNKGIFSFVNLLTNVRIG